MWDFFLFVGVCCFIGALLIGAVVVPVNYMAGKSCEAKAALMEVPYQYSLMTDCMIKTANGWLPINQYKVFAPDMAR
jgi:hypothetical protein